MTRAILLHAFAADRLTWAGTVPALGRIRAETLDLPGHGAALDDLGDATLADLSAPVAARLDAGEPAWLVGHSLGGAVALRLAAAHPEQVRGLVLIAPLGFGEALDLGALSAVPDIGEVAEMQRFLQRLVADPSLIQPVFAEYALEQLDRPGARAATARIAAALPGYIAEVGAHADAVRAAGLPVTVVWGGEDRVARPDRDKVGMFGDYVEIEGAGHIPHVEAAKTVNRLLKERILA